MFKMSFMLVSYIYRNPFRINFYINHITMPSCCFYRRCYFTLLFQISKTTLDTLSSVHKVPWMINAASNTALSCENRRKASEKKKT